LRIAAAAGSLAVVIAVVLSGCAAPGGPSDTVITANGTEPQNPLIPALTVESGGARVVDNIFAGLVAYEDDGSAVNDAADSFVASADSTVFTVALRDDLAFTNGEDLTAESFARAWDWAADSANETAYPIRPTSPTSPDSSRTTPPHRRWSAVRSSKPAAWWCSTTAPSRST
jgi:oligopeptide transport system substrate-binding protein